MKIELIIGDIFGSSAGVTSKTIWGDGRRIGVGGSELAVLTMCEEWTRAGHEVIFYNNPIEPNTLFEQRGVNTFDVNGKHEILIAFRSPSNKVISAKADLKVWWSCDQYTIGNYREFASSVEKIVVISPFHEGFFKAVYGILNATCIDLPVRVRDYEGYDIGKVPRRFLFSSVPDRGLDAVHRMWKAIRQKCPGSHLVITADYRLWGTPDTRNQQYRSRWVSEKDFTFLGAISRKQLVEEQLKADILLYPCTYEELFCISVAEAQVAGAYPITSNIGSLSTTNLGEHNFAVNAVDPRNDVIFIKAVIGLLEDRDKLEECRKQVQIKALEKFHPKEILRQWNERIFT